MNSARSPRQCWLARLHLSWRNLTLSCGCLRLAATCSVALGLGSAAHAQDLRAVEADLLHGRVDVVVRAVQQISPGSPAYGQAQLLLCRAQLSEFHGDDAAQSCQQALDHGLAQNSAAQDWAGRAFGAKAQHAGPISGMHLAGAVRSAFQTAHTLDARSAAAANDLGEYYVAAPFIVGGGVDKALALASALQATLPETSHRLRALAAEKKEDFAGAEREFTLATQVAQSTGSWVDLANFYQRRGSADKALSAVRRSLAVNAAVDSSAFDAAQVLDGLHQPAEAAAALRKYLDHGTQSDAAPTFRAHTLLGEVLRRMGDKEGARREFQAALVLASGFGPARKGLGSL